MGNACRRTDGGRWETHVAAPTGLMGNACRRTDGGRWETSVSVPKGNRFPVTEKRPTPFGMSLEILNSEFSILNY
jgi:hypothetical protein